MAVQTHYEITHSCGHIDPKRDLSAKPAGDRAGFAKWLAKSDCFECFKASKADASAEGIQARRETEAAEAALAAEQMELPDLIGSEKQIPWATRIRHNLIRGAYDGLVQESELEETEFDSKVVLPARLADKAKWWIDNREATPTDLPELLESVGTDVTASTTENPF